jgi:hypothetical protein
VYYYVLSELLNNGTFLVQTGQSVARNFLTEFWPIREAFSWCGLEEQRGKKRRTTDGSKLRTSSSWMALLYQAFYLLAQMSCK